MSFDKCTQIGQTTLTFDWLERTLRQSLNTDATLIDCTASRIGEGFGFISYVIHLQLSWDQQNEDLPRDLVLKVPTSTNIDSFASKSRGTFECCFSTDGESTPAAAVMQDFMQMVAPGMKRWVKKAHNCECEFYQLFAPWREQLRMPRCFHVERAEMVDGTQNPGAIIMECLGDRGVTGAVTHMMQLQSLLEVAEALASLHACSLQNRSLWEGNEYLIGGMGYMEGITDEQMKGSLQMTIDMLKKVWPERFDPLADRLHDCGYGTNGLYLAQSLNRELNMPPVLGHGDLWLNNMMFHKDTNGQPSDKLLSIIDWQTVSTTCVAEDFTNLLSSASPMVRRQYTDTILQHYYSSLKEKLNGIDPGFSYETLVVAYKCLFKRTVATVVGYFPFFAEENTKVADNLIDCAHAMLEDAVAMID